VSDCWGAASTPAVLFDLYCICGSVTLLETRSLGGAIEMVTFWELAALLSCRGTTPLILI